MPGQRKERKRKAVSDGYLSSQAKILKDTGAEQPELEPELGDNQRISVYTKTTHVESSDYETEDDASDVDNSYSPRKIRGNISNWTIQKGEILFSKILHVYEELFKEVTRPGKRNRKIASSSPGVKEALKANNFTKSLYYNLIYFDKNDGTLCQEGLPLEESSKEKYFTYRHFDNLAYRNAEINDEFESLKKLQRYSGFNLSAELNEDKKLVVKVRHSERADEIFEKLGITSPINSTLTVAEDFEVAKINLDDFFAQTDEHPTLPQIDAQAPFSFDMTEDINYFSFSLWQKPAETIADEENLDPAQFLADCP